MHDAEGSTLTLDNGDVVRVKVLIDATGFESRLIKEALLAQGTIRYLMISDSLWILAHVDNNGPYDMKRDAFRLQDRTFQ